MPGSTLAAFADHGTLAGDTVHANYLAARAHLEHLQRIGIDYEQVTDTLEREGLTNFENSWDELGVTVARELDTSSTRRVSSQVRAWPARRNEMLGLSLTHPHARGGKMLSSQVGARLRAA